MPDTYFDWGYLSIKLNLDDLPPDSKIRLVQAIAQKAGIELTEEQGRQIDEWAYKPQELPPILQRQAD